MRYELVDRTSASGDAPPDVLKAAGNDMLLARLLHARGVSDAEDVKAFLNPDESQLNDPFAFRDMKKAVALIRDAAESGRPVFVHGDYDVDGTCGSALLSRALKNVGCNVQVRIPQRTGSGYGLSEDAVREMPEGALLITVDCGISDCDAIDLARSKNMDVIVTDHHTCPETLPSATCILNPKAPGETYPDSRLCGASVAMKLAQAAEGRDTPDEYLDLAALATIADIVPMVGENRTIAALGLKKMNSAPSPGVAALAAARRSPDDEITAATVSFDLAPAINAAGRVASGSLAYDLLSSTNPKIAELLAQTLTELNLERRSRQSRVLDEAIAMLKDAPVPDFIVLHSDAWHVGVIGPAASKLAEQYQRPVMLFARVADAYVGSGRSWGEVSMYEALSSASHLTDRFGGHIGAAGATVQPENLPMFRQAMQDFMLRRRHQISGPVSAEYDFEAQLPVDPSIISSLSRLEPFGEGNPRPVALVRDARLANRRPLGAEGQHTSFSIESAGGRMRGVFFGTRPGDVPEVGDVLGELQVSSFGQSAGTPEMIVRTVSWETPEENYFRRAAMALRQAGGPKNPRLFYRDKDRMRVIYSAFRRAAPKEETVTMPELYARARALLPDLTREETAFAHAVFIELNLITDEPNGRIRIVVNTTKCDLDDSSIYRTCGR